jgi:HEAT repeat protein
MNPIDSLMHAVQVHGPQRAKAIDELALVGEPALPKLVEALATGVAVPLWTAVLIALRMQGKAAALTRYVDHPDRTVRAAIIRALGRSGDVEAVEPLIALLRAGEPVRILAAALGDLGDARALAPLREVAAALVGQPMEPAGVSARTKRAAVDARSSRLREVVGIAESLAKLGDMLLAPAVIELVGFGRDQPGSDEAANVRRVAARALTVLVAPGVSDALHRACRDVACDVWIEALGATALLGRVAEMRQWLAMLADQTLDEVRRWNLLACLHDSCGDAPDVEDRLPTASELDRWWADVAPRFESGVCYRAGQPTTPGLLLVRMMDDNVGLARRELRAMTGLPGIQEMLGGVPVTPAERAAMTSWWVARQQELPAGKLHRWGRTYEPNAVD